MSARVEIKELMNQSGVKFGTSGARGLVSQMTDSVCAAYTTAFLEHLKDSYGLSSGTPVVIGGDRRPSTPRIMRAVASAATRLGYRVENAGLVPSPAVALRGLQNKCPAIMVTGSHIPDDRNGIKFNTPQGEVTKADEAGMLSRSVSIPDAYDASGMLTSEEEKGAGLGVENSEAIEAYRRRYLEVFPKDCLRGVKLGVYGHSAVGRDFFVSLYEALGAEVTKLGFSEKFIPVDTEAIRPEDSELAARWAKDQPLDSIVSSDGDSDRPLTSDENGKWIRGDVSGILTAKYLGADAVATPVSCNTAVEKAGTFARVVRTRIGSPFVIAGMEEAASSGATGIVGYEANGGFLTQTSLSIGDAQLPALPTRDAVIVHLALLLSAKAQGLSLSRILESLPTRYTSSDRDQSFAQERSAELLAKLASLSENEVPSAFGLGKLLSVDTTDGRRMTFQEGESEVVVHLRPSGNAPELRCYAEADTEARSLELVAIGLEKAALLAPSAS